MAIKLTYERPYKTACYMCGAKVSRSSFDVVLGIFAAFLCSKCFKKVGNVLEGK